MPKRPHSQLEPDIPRRARVAMKMPQGRPRPWFDGRLPTPGRECPISGRRRLPFRAPPMAIRLICLCRHRVVTPPVADAGHEYSRHGRSCR